MPTTDTTQPARDLQQKVLNLACELIRARSITPDDAGCQTILSSHLLTQGFSCESVNSHDVTNLWATRTFGSGTGPHLIFAGHTDVVPTGPLDLWSGDPFVPRVEDGLLRGRGAADMKSSLAAMVVATENLDTNLNGTLSFLLTSDEEGPAVHGTRHVINVLEKRGIVPDFCIIGEPSSSRTIGDTVRCGRRGSLNGQLLISGVQGHVAYPEHAVNPIHYGLQALADLSSEQWDDGNDFYPPTTFQISNLTAGTGATNVVPAQAEIQFNFRFNTEQTVESLVERTQQILAPIMDRAELEWSVSGLPFLTKKGRLTAIVEAAIKTVTGTHTEFSTSGGTSDGRFISHWNQADSNRVEVIELGPTNATIHKTDECIAIGELVPLAQMYSKIAEGLLTV